MLINFAKDAIKNFNSDSENYENNKPQRIVDLYFNENDEMIEKEAKIYVKKINDDFDFDYKKPQPQNQL